MTIVAYLRHTASLDGPFCTEHVEAKDAPLDWQLQGLSYTATGYGKKIPTSIMVYFEGRWRRVYQTIYSNIGSNWIVYQGEKIKVSVYHN